MMEEKKGKTICPPSPKPENSSSAIPLSFAFLPTTSRIELQPAHSSTPQSFSAEPTSSTSSSNSKTHFSASKPEPDPPTEPMQMGSSYFNENQSRSSIVKPKLKLTLLYIVPKPLDQTNSMCRSTDGTVRIWDCHTARCVNVINIGVEVTSLICEGPWIFVGLRNAVKYAEYVVVVVVKAWNIQTGSEFTLDRPKEQVLAMIVGNDTLFATAEWGNPEANCPFALVASLSGHTKAAVCLAVGGKMLYSGSMDQSIKVWDLETLECKMTLKEHTDVVTSLICWDDYLLSSSFGFTIKVWVATEEGTLKVTYTHTEEKGVVVLG
ncbi:hypothetical protein RJT34_20118 [Clitoria ternatea]|uniref:Uncharacterized protein n=1 Tax=Clitoria ternatea TaxID=43366 RepID=A0AAN9P5E9_CLITE